jgi:plasmid stability protein
MPNQLLTLQLPDVLYRRIKDRADRSNRSVEAETVELLASAVPLGDELPRDLAEALAPLPLLADGELWQAARRRLAPEVVSEMEGLHLKQQREKLTETERQRVTSLVHQYERAMLIRAQAAALLKQRGHDVSCLLREP